MVLIVFPAGAVCLILLVVGHNTAWGAAPQVVEIVLLGMDILFNVIATGERPPTQSFLAFVDSLI